MATKVPAFTYSGSSSSKVEGGYWYIYLKSNGTLKMTYAKSGVQACIVGGGAGGTKNGSSGGSTGDSKLGGAAGGGGGAVNNKTNISIAAGTSYTITVGTGGEIGSDGTSSSAFGYSAEGGKVGTGTAGAKNGGAGQNGTYAFGDSSLPRYGAGGGGGGTSHGGNGGAGGKDGGGNGADGANYSETVAAATAGTANTGGGGGGPGGYMYWDDSTRYKAGGSAAKGGSGVVIIRGTQDDLLPVYFNGKQLSEVHFNGEKLTGLIYGGKRIFARLFRRNGFALESRWQTAGA